MNGSVSSAKKTSRLKFYTIPPKTYSKRSTNLTVHRCHLVVVHVGVRGQLFESIAEWGDAFLKAQQNVFNLVHFFRTHIRYRLQVWPRGGHKRLVLWSRARGSGEVGGGRSRHRGRLATCGCASWGGWDLHAGTGTPHCPCGQLRSEYRCTE